MSCTFPVLAECKLYHICHSCYFPYFMHDNQPLCLLQYLFPSIMSLTIFKSSLALVRHCGKVARVIKLVSRIKEFGSSLFKTSFLYQPKQLNSGSILFLSPVCLLSINSTYALHNPHVRFFCSLFALIHNLPLR